MAFIASQLALQRGFESLLSVASQQKTYLANWNSKLNGNITALDAVAIVSSVNQALAAMDQYTALPGMAAYAQAQFGNGIYNVATEYTAMRNALIAVRDWLITNIPSNAITITNGVQVGTTYTPAQTASLKSLVVAAAATIA
jgi:hypothetical protein